MSVPPGVDPSGKSWLPALITGGASVAGSVLAFLLNKKETDTAHQREVKDLKAAGINPLMTAQGRGAASADTSQIGSSVDRASSNALAVRMARAQIDATEAQAQQSRAAALLSRVQAGDLETQAQFGGRYTKMKAESDLAELSVAERRQMIPILVARAKAEVTNTLASADRTKVLAQLDRLRVEGFKNIETLEKGLGAAGPAGRLLLEVLRTLR